MKLQYAKDPRRANPSSTFIDLIVKWEEFNEELPFTASPNDPELYGREIYALAAAGDFGPVAAYVSPPILVPPNAQQEAARKLAYEQEADPIFFMAQRGEATIAEWEAKIAEIKARYPYQE